MLLAPILVIPGCSLQNSQRNVPVIRLPQEVVYSQDADYYIVRPGDTIYSIAWHFGLDFRALAKGNGVDKHFAIQPGQRLKVAINPPVIPKKVKIFSIPKSTPSKSIRNRNVPKVKVTSQQKSLSIDSNREKKSVTKWIWPVKGKLVDGYSSHRGGNKGIDILTSGPKPVHAVADGKVVYSGEGLRGYGKLVIIKHNEDFLSAYAYNSKIRVKEQDQVKVGEVIADTGIHGLYKNRLHLEIRFKGKPVNPLIYLRQ